MSDQPTREDGETSRIDAPEGAESPDVVREQVRATRHAKWHGEVIEPLPLSELEKPLDEIDTAEREPPPLDARPEPSPRIEGYRILREISRGGQAAVFHAVYEPTGRAVAVKVMSGGPYITARNRDRFEREVKILGSLDHPGVVKVIDRGRTVDGSFFFSMDYVDGCQLDEWLDARRHEGAGQREVVETTVKILAALQAAHELGVVHRDVKPSNVRVDGHGEPRVLDFGLARLTELNEGDADRWRTQTGNVVGSLPWASPEQAAGDLDKLGPPSDVYSVGIVLYHALAGRWPYELAGTVLDKATTIRDAEPAPLRGVAGPFGVVDAALAAVVMRALRKAPADRFPTAAAMAEALQAWIRGDAVVGYEAPPELAPWQRRPVRWIAAGVTVAIATAAVTGLTASRERANVPATIPLPAPVALNRITNSIGMTLVEVPDGWFLMGSPPNQPYHDATEQIHHVNITRPFYLATLETTRQQYRTIMGRTPGNTPPDQDDLPVDRVSGEDALEFCRRLSQREGRKYRLPTEAEWEYACRTATGAMFGDGGKLEEVGWFAENSEQRVHRGGEKRSNRWGLYDMNGNVAEWTADCYILFLGSEEQTDPYHPAENALPSLIKGGNFASPMSACRAAARMTVDSLDRRLGIGFRVLLVEQTVMDQPRVPFSAGGAPQ